MNILFYGDSITDAGSYGKTNEEMTGYGKYVFEALKSGGRVFFNRGRSGDRSIDLVARYEDDVKSVVPDIMSVLIGINDVWRQFDGNLYTSPKEYAQNLTDLIVRTKRDFVNVKIIVCEPFLLPYPDKIHWREELWSIIDACREVAVKYADSYIPFDGIFAEERIRTDWKKLSADGVHPDTAGQKLIARKLIREIRKYIGEKK